MKWLYPIFTVLVLNFLLLGMAIWMLFWPVELAEVYNEPFPVYPSEVQKGESISYEIEFRKTKQYTVESNKNIICDDGSLITLAPTHTDAPLGLHKAVGSVNIPVTASVATCYLEFNTTYFINPLRTEHRTMRTQEFKIIE